MGAEHLLSQKKLRQYVYAIDEAKRQLEHHEGQHELIGKYHRRHWFKKMMQKTEVQLLGEYYQHAKVLYMLEADIKYYKEAIGAHAAAVEDLQDSMDPFAGVNLKEVQLVQLDLF